MILIIMMFFFVISFAKKKIFSQSNTSTPPHFPLLHTHLLHKKHTHLDILMFIFIFFFFFSLFISKKTTFTYCFVVVYLCVCDLPSFLLFSPFLPHFSPHKTVHSFFLPISPLPSPGPMGLKLVKKKSNFF